MTKLWVASIVLFTALYLPGISAYCTDINDAVVCTSMDSEKAEEFVNIFMDIISYNVRTLRFTECNLTIVRDALFSNERFSQITDLAFSGDQIEFIELDSFAALPNLQYLRFSGNKLNQFDGRVLTGLGKLRKLELLHNGVDTLANFCYGAKNLEEILFEDWKEMGAVDSNIFVGCSRVEKLTMIGAGITSFKNDLGSQLPELKLLNLTDNKVINLDFLGSGGPLVKLEKLDVTRNEIIDVRVDLLQNILPNLKRFNVSSNHLDSFMSHSNGTFQHKLEYLSLNTNNITALNRDMFKYFHELVNLDVDGNQLQEIEAGTFADTPLVYVLHICTSLSTMKNLKAGAFHGLRSVDTLDLSAAGIESLEPEAFEGLVRLSKLNLTGNKITSLRNGTFLGLNELSALYLSGYISIIDPGAFSGLQRLQDLDFQSFFRVTQLRSRQFEGVSYNSFTTLNLSRLGIHSMEKETFQGLYGLYYLYLQENQFEEIPAGAFSGLGNLRRLNISENPLQLIHQDAFGDIPKLYYLIISHCNISNLPANTFQGLPSLTILDLSHNQLSKTTPGLFRRLHSLQELYLHENSLEHILAQSFIGLNSLRKLTLHGNYVTNVDPGAFIGLTHYSSSLNLKTFFTSTVIKTAMFDGLYDLKTVDFSGKGIEKIETGAFLGIGFLRLLSLDNNNLTTIEPGAFADPEYISYFSLVNNSLTNLPKEAFVGARVTLLDLSGNSFEEFQFGWFRGTDNLEILNLTRAGIKSLENNVNLSFLPNLKTIKLKDNFISTLAEGSFSGLNRLQDLDLSGNPLTVISDVAFMGLPALKTLTLSGIEGSSLTNAPFTILDLLQNLKIVSSSITELTSDTFSTLSTLRTLNLSHNDISSIHLNGPVNLTILDLSYNRLTQIQEDTFGNDKTDLRELYLNDNGLTYIAAKAFQNLTSLRKLHLQNNRINQVHVYLFHGLTNLEELNMAKNFIRNILQGTFTGLEAVKNLNIANNELNDTSSLYDLKNVEHLDVNNNELNIVDMNVLKHLSKLNYIGLTGNSWYCSDLLTIIQFYQLSYIKFGADEDFKYAVKNINGIQCY